MVRLDILADFVCPWCYVGKANLDRALEAHPGHPFAVEWHPYELNPGLPAEGMARDTYMEMKFGDAEGVIAAHRPLLAEAAKAGIEMNLPAIARTPNTLNAHRLAHWALLEGRQAAVISALFRAYWREGRDIGDTGVLAEIAGEAGLDRAMTARLFETDADREEIEARMRHARARGVQSIPTYIVANTYVLQGAQPPAVWGRLIDEIAANAPQDTPE